MNLKKRFSRWIRWEERENAKGIKHPGVYIIAISKTNISGKFRWLVEKELVSKIKYIGMTNSIKGLKGRLKQFDNTISGKQKSHGGADRVRYRYPNYKKLVKKLFVAVSPVDVDVKTEKPENLRLMGEILKFEYDCFADFVKKFGSMPEFNNKKSLKYSSTKGKKR